MATTRLFYARAVLQAIGVTDDNVHAQQALVAVMTGEDSTAHWNPMDTTLEIRGSSTPYNSFGPSGAYHVWNYTTAAVGLRATALTLQQENMRPFYDALHSSTLNGLEMARAFSKTPWGGIGDILPLEIVQDWNSGTRNYIVDRTTLVHGSGPWPYNANGKLMG